MNIGAEPVPHEAWRGRCDGPPAAAAAVAVAPPVERRRVLPAERSGLFKPPPGLKRAARVIEKGATVIRFRGEELNAINVQQRLQVRDFMDELRGSGVNTGGPPPFSAKDKQNFANALDRWLSRAQAKRS